MVAALATKATVMAIEMRSIMPGRHWRTSWKPPFRNGQPPHRKMKVPRTGATQAEPAKRGMEKPNHIWTISL